MLDFKRKIIEVYKQTSIVGKTIVKKQVSLMFGINITIQHNFKPWTQAGKIN